MVKKKIYQQNLLLRNKWWTIKKQFKLNLSNGLYMYWIGKVKGFYSRKRGWMGIWIENLIPPWGGLKFEHGCLKFINQVYVILFLLELNVCVSSFYFLSFLFSFKLIMIYLKNLIISLLLKIILKTLNILCGGKRPYCIFKTESVHGPSLVKTTT
jgi:hypothetical protein